METPIPGQMERLWNRGKYLGILRESRPRPGESNGVPHQEPAPHCICALIFGSIPFHPISLSSALSQCLSGGCKGFRFHSQPAIASDLPSASAVLACHITRYLTHTYTYLPISVLFIISLTLYISPYPQEDSYPFLFGSPARYVHV